MKHLIAVLILSQLYCLAVAETVATAASFWYLNDTDTPTIEFDGNNLPTLNAYGPAGNGWGSAFSLFEVTDTFTRFDASHLRNFQYTNFRNNDGRGHTQYFVEEGTPWTMTVEYQGTTPIELNDLNITLINAVSGEVVFELDMLRPGVYSGVLPSGLYNFDYSWDYINATHIFGSLDIGQMLMRFELDTYDCPTLDGDFDGDGDVDLGDLAIMLSNFAISCP